MTSDTETKKSNNKSEATTKVVIVGTGDMAHGLANVYHCFGNKERFDVSVVEPLPGVELTTQYFHDTGVKIVANVVKDDIDEVLREADLVILAFPSKFHGTFLSEREDVLCDGSKILVDISNDANRGRDLDDALPHGDALRDVVPWVKAFNDTGAVALMAQTPSNKSKIVTEICGRNADAVQAVKDFGERGLGFDVKVVPHECYRDIRDKQQTIGKEWKVAILSLLALFVLTEIYAMFRYNYNKGYDWYHLLLQVTNKVSATALKASQLHQMYNSFDIHSSTHTPPLLPIVPNNCLWILQ